MKRKKRLPKLLKWLFAIIIVALIILAIWWGWVRSHSNELWKIVSEQCIPHQQLSISTASPCIDVVLTPETKRGYAIFKDRKGPLHFLLIPTAKIDGIESKELQQPDSTDYLYQAWMARYYLAQQVGKPISREMVSLAVNSAYGRSQEQLHIHIACIKPEIQAQLGSQMDTFSEKWSSVPYGINNHHYIARTLTESQLREVSPFQRVAMEVSDAADNMEKYGLALVAYTGHNNMPMYLLLANRLDIFGMNVGHTSDIQDYQCDLLKTENLF
ncbi:CDP-diacylglycerol diphosphatase [Limnobaculum parvum]|nr:CDP-diacylglycerol diphosphatase [Limnobaculum parvum]